MAAIVKYKRINAGENGVVDSEDNENGATDNAQLVIENYDFIKNDKQCCSCHKRRCLADCKNCIKRSWIAVLLGSLIFVAAFVISFVIVSIVKEPKQPSYNSGVAADVPICSQIAGTILEQGGSAVDAAITAMLCVGVVNPESSGTGGGGFMVIYDPANQSSIAIDFREVASMLASTNMFHSNSTLSLLGGLSVSVPGELACMKKAHEMFGRLSWKQLFEPIVNLSRDGYRMTKHNEIAVNHNRHYFSKDSLFYSWYINEDGSLKTFGDLIKRPEYSQFLHFIAENGINEFYNGTIAEEIVKEVQSNGGILTLDDFSYYEPLVYEAITMNITDSLFITTGLPSSGPLLLFILNVMSKLIENNQIIDNKWTQQHLIETFKYSFAIRSKLGDPWCDQCDTDTIINTQNSKLLNNDYAEYINLLITNNQTFNVSHYNTSAYTNDYGTSHISVIDPNGMAVAVTTSVNTYFGSKLITPISGIVLNNDMDDFSSPNITNNFGVPPTKINYIKPGKRAQSSITPLIVLKRNSEGHMAVNLVTGGSGGTHITTATAQAAIRALYFGESNSESVENRRLHHQLIPNTLFYEDGYNESIISFLQSIGHNIQQDESHAVIQQLLTDNAGNITAHSDSRKGGEAFVTNINT